MESQVVIQVEIFSIELCPSHGIRMCELVVTISHHVFIDVVRDEKDVVLLAEVTDHVDLVALIHLPQRVVRVVEDDGLRLRVKQVRQLGRIQLPIGRRRHAVLLRLRSCNEATGRHFKGSFYSPILGPFGIRHCPHLDTHRGQRDEPGRAAGEPDHRLVAVEIRLDDDDLVAGVDEAHDGGEERLVRTLSHQDLLQRIDLLVTTL